MQMMRSMEGMDMDMGTPSCVWSIPVLNLAQWEVVEEHLEEDLDPQLEDLNSGS